MTTSAMSSSSEKTIATQPELAKMLHAARLAAAQSDPHSVIDPLPQSELDAPIESAIEESGEDQLSPQIEGFTIVDEISSGGQATVFKAIQKSTGQTVAIKVLPGGRLVGARRKERFDREAHVLASLTHPN